MLKNVAFDQNLTCITPQRSFWMGNQTHPTLELFSYCGSVHSSDAKRELRRTYCRVLYDIMWIQPTAKRAGRVVQRQDHRWKSWMSIRDLRNPGFVYKSDLPEEP